MGNVSNRIKNLSESQTIAMAKRSRELRAEGKDIISLSLGEPDFNTPDFIKEAAKQAIDDNFSSYTPVPGYLDLRESISKKFKRDNNLNYAPSQIVTSTGAKQSIANVVLSLVNPGDEVILPAPYWVSYLEIIKMAEGIPVIVNAGIESDFKITAEQLEGAMSDKTKMMIFSSPCNPTGSIYSKAELESLSKVIATKKNFYVLADEIYEHINFAGKHESLAQFEDIYEQVITVNGVSKGFAMTGWRLGYIGAPEWIAKACDKIQGQFTSATCSITQRAVITAMQANPADLSYMKEAFQERRNFIVERFKKIDGLVVNEPEGAFYLFPNVAQLFGKKNGNTVINTATDLCMYLLEEAEVALVTGEAFGSPECVRISYATSMEVLKEAVDRIEKAIKALA